MKKVIVLLISLSVVLSACVPTFLVPTQEVVYVEITSTPEPTNTPTTVPTETPTPVPTNTPVPPTPKPEEICDHTLGTLEDEFGITYTTENSILEGYEYESRHKMGNNTILFYANQNNAGCVREAGITVIIDLENFNESDTEKTITVMFMFAKFFDPVNAQKDVLDGIADIVTSPMCEHGKSDQFVNERPNGSIWMFDCYSEKGTPLMGYTLQIELYKNTEEG